MEYTIYVYWKKGMISSDVSAAIDGVYTFVDSLRKTRAANMPNDSVRISGVNPEIESFVRNLPKVGGLTNAEKICDLLHQMHDGYSVGLYLTNEPISDGRSYLVGLTHAVNITVSTSHFRNLHSNERFDSIKLCVMHELGHTHGMVGMAGRVNSEQNCGNHCTDPLCLMQQTNGNFALLMRRHYAGWFCPLCLEDVRTRKLNLDSAERRRQGMRLPNPAKAVPDSAPRFKSLPPRSDQPSVRPPLPPRRS